MSIYSNNVCNLQFDEAHEIIARYDTLKHTREVIPSTCIPLKPVIIIDSESGECLYRR